MKENLWNLATSVLQEVKTFFSEDEWKVNESSSQWTLHFEGQCNSGDLLGSTEVYPYERMLHTEIALPVELNGLPSKDVLPFVNEVNRQSSSGIFFVDNRNIFLRNTLFYAESVPSTETITNHYVLLMDSAAYFTDFLNKCLAKPADKLKELFGQMADQNDLFPGQN